MSVQTCDQTHNEKLEFENNAGNFFDRSSSEDNYSSPFFILTNGHGDAPQLFNFSKNNASVGNFSTLNDPDTIGSVEQTDYILKQYHKRDKLEDTLEKRFPDVKFSNDLFDFQDIWKEAVIEIKDLNSAYNREGFPRSINFANCYSSHGSSGRVYVDVDEPEKSYYQPYRCSEPICLYCDDVKRKQLFAKWMNKWKQIITNNRHNPDFHGTIHFVFTLPQSVEGEPLYDKNLEKTLLDGIQNIIRKLFGRTIKSRSNIFMYLSVHPCSDDDLFRDRWHVHLDVIPAEITKNEASDKKLQWLMPIDDAIASDHTIDQWKLSFDWLKNEWNTLLLKAFKKDLDAGHPFVEFIPSSPHTTYWKKRLDIKQLKKHHLDDDGAFDDRYFAKIGHKLKYNMRTFAGDIENHVLRTDIYGKRVVLKAKAFAKDNDDKQECWYIKPVSELVNRFIFIREHNKVRARGWGQKMKAYADILGLKENGPGEKPTAYGMNAKRQIVREKVYDKKKEKVIWHRDELYSWWCPIKKTNITKSKNDMKKWRWGSGSLN